MPLPQALPHRRYSCGNDMVCGWAGALAGADGINIVSGTGSIAYGEFAGRNARAGGWGELFSDEGSSYWLAREGLRLFARMSDGRSPRGSLYEHVRRHFSLRSDLDLCAAIYGKIAAQRSQFAQLSRLVIVAAKDGDRAALGPHRERCAGACRHSRCRAPPTADSRRGDRGGVRLRGNVSTGKRAARAVRGGAAATLCPLPIRPGVVPA